ncbi:MAG: hypothetical protein ABL864_14935 [Terricaulis sp.]
MTAIVEKKWTELRRARRAADGALSLSVRLMRDGDLASASRAALLAERLARLDVAAEQRKRAAKAAHRRAEDALAAAERQVDLFVAAKPKAPPPSEPTIEFSPEVLAAKAECRRQAQRALGLPVTG